MKVFLSSDMEGTAGVVDWAQCVGDGPEAAAGRRLLLGEVNAAIEGAPAGLSHTYNPRAVMEARLNGVVTGEAGINALVAAHYGVPVVLVTGDRCACEETAALIPGVHAAVVKEPVSRLAAHSLHPARACALGVDRTGPRELRCTGDDPLAIYRSFCAAILLTRGIAETV